MFAGQNLIRVLALFALLSLIHSTCVVAAQPRSAGRFAHPDVATQGGQAVVRDLRFTHLTTDGLSQNYVNAILQDRRGFMWFATRDGLNRYDGNAFIVYKHTPTDQGSLSANFVEDLMEDDQSGLWVATFSGGVDRFDPGTERYTHYRQDPGNLKSIAGDSVQSLARDRHGNLWLGTGDYGRDKFDPRTGTAIHYVTTTADLLGRLPMLW